MSTDKNDAEAMIRREEWDFLIEGGGILGITIAHELHSSVRSQD